MDLGEREKKKKEKKKKKVGNRVTKYLVVGKFGEWLRDDGASGREGNRGYRWKVTRAPRLYPGGRKGESRTINPQRSQLGMPPEVGTFLPALIVTGLGFLEKA